MWLKYSRPVQSPEPQAFFQRLTRRNPCPVSQVRVSSPTQLPIERRLGLRIHALCFQAPFLLFVLFLKICKKEAPALPEQSRSPSRVESSRGGPGFAAFFCPRRGIWRRAGASHERASLYLSFFCPLGGDRQSGASVGKSPTGDRLTH